MNNDTTKLAVKASLFFYACRSIDRRKCPSSALCFSSSQMVIQSKSLFSKHKDVRTIPHDPRWVLFAGSMFVNLWWGFDGEQISKHQAIYLCRLPGSIHTCCIEAIVAFGTPCRLAGQISVPSKYIGGFIGVYQKRICNNQFDSG